MINFSGPRKTVGFDLPVALHEELKVAAIRRQVSMQAVVQRLLEEWLADDEPKPSPVKAHGSLVDQLRGVIRTQADVDAVHALMVVISDRDKALDGASALEDANQKPPQAQAKRRRGG